MSDSFQSERPYDHVNIKLARIMGVTQRKAELPLKLSIAGDFSNGSAKRTIFEQETIDIDTHNVNSALTILNPEVSLTITHNLTNIGAAEIAECSFQNTKDVEAETVRNQILQLHVSSPTCDMKANPFDNINLKKERKGIFKNFTLCDESNNDPGVFPPIWV